MEKEWVGRTFETLNCPTPVLSLGNENVCKITRHVFSYVIFLGLDPAVSSYKFAWSLFTEFFGGSVGLGTALRARRSRVRFGWNFSLT